MRQKPGPAGILLPAFAVAVLLAGQLFTPAHAFSQEGQGAGATERPSVALVIRPVVTPAGQVTDVDVLETVEATPDGGAPFAVRIPVVVAGVPGIADGVHDLTMSDQGGAVPLQQADDPPDPSNFMYFRNWRATRPVRGAVTVRYRFHLATPAPRSGPPFDLRSNGGGVSGAGVGFLVLPDDKRVYSVSMKWDLSGMAPGSSAMSSLGAGDVQVTMPMEPVAFSFYMAGPLHRYPATGSAGGFSAAWIGEPPFDADAAMARSAKAYDALREFFHDKNPPPFRVLMRTGPDNISVGGAQLTNSFMLFLPTDPRLTRDLDGTIAHEMVHHWVESLEGKPGLIAWWGEGLAEYFSRIAIFRAGLMTPEEFLANINRKAVRYYTNPLINLPNDEVPNAFWRDRNGQVIPYDRGFFYFVDLNRKLLEKSHGKVSIDDLVREMIAARKQGKPPTTESWLEATRRELGPVAKQEWESTIVKGNTIVPPSDAFGPCFARKAVKLRQFDLGFDERASLYTLPRIIHGVEPGSAADAAGLRNGDEVVNILDLDDLRSEPDKRVELDLRRDGRELKISYLPRARAVQGYEWVRVAGVPDSRCRAH